MNSRKKILTIISEQTYIRNYLATDALQELSATHDLKFALINDIRPEDHPLAKAQIVGSFSYSPESVARHNKIFQVLAWRHRKKSRTFFYRWLRQSNWNSVARKKSSWAKVGAFLRWVAGLISDHSLLIGPVLGSKFLINWSLKIMDARNQPNAELAGIIESQSWDLIVIPSAGFEPSTFDAIRLARRIGIPTLALIDNWDNLVSKTIFWHKPDHIGVWGKQAQEQALLVQGFEANRIHLIGTPRFDEYYLMRKSFAESRGDYLLFVGSAMPFDELGALHSIEQELQSAGFSDMKIVYRPHPWQQKRNVKSSFDESEFRITVLDPQIAEAKRLGIQRSPTDTRFQPELSYYPTLFQGARIVVGPLTTMLLEASLCLRPVIGLSYDDGNHFTTTVKYFTHFDGMERVPGFQFCSTKNELGTLIVDGLHLPQIDGEAMDRSMEQFLVPNENPYPARLTNLVNRILHEIR